MAAAAVATLAHIYNGEDTSQLLGDAINENENENNLQPSFQFGNANDFQLLIQSAFQTLVKSDLDGEELEHSYGSASQGLWMHAPSAKNMQRLLNKVTLKVRSIVIV